MKYLKPFNESKNMKILDFMSAIITDDMLKQFKSDNKYYYQGNNIRPLSISDVESIVKYSRTGYSYLNIKFELPFKVVDHDDSYDQDHDHGAWTERYVIEMDGKFYAMCFDYYGQGDFHDDQTQWNEVTEVKPRTITKVVYE